MHLQGGNAEDESREKFTEFKVESVLVGLQFDFTNGYWNVTSGIIDEQEDKIYFKHGDSSQNLSSGIHEETTENSQKDITKQVLSVNFKKVILH